MTFAGACPHGQDPRACPSCAPALVERFRTIAEAFAIVEAIGRCPHGPPHLTIGGVTFCSACGARKTQGGTWKPTDLAKRAIALASRADLSNPWKNTA